MLISDDDLLGILGRKRHSYGTPLRILSRFWPRIDKTEGCWNWTGYIHPFGYGYLGVGDKFAVKAHRLSWMIHHGAIPDGLLICHKCDNRRCVNPDHLFLGTHKDNLQDMSRKGRGRTGSSKAWARRGEVHPSAKLTAAQVTAIRQRLAAGEEGRKLTWEFAVSKAQISRIKNGKRWCSNAL